MLPLGLHPDQNDGADRIAGVLQHAPFAFRTITAAMVYARQFLPTANNGLFWSQTVATVPPKTVTIRHIVIHCLPGVYGPLVAGLPNIDPASGLPFNGETWPVVLPSFVSIQGTSALDDFHVLGVAVCLHFDGRTVERASIRLGGAGSHPVPATESEALLAGKKLSDEVIEAAAQAAFKPAHAMDNTDHEAAWRKKMAPVFGRRALRDCLK